MKPLPDQPIQPVSVIDTYPLSSMQAGMLVHALRSVPGEGIDVQQIGMTILTPLDPGLFVYAWYQVMERHAVLRTRLRWEGVPEGPVQEVLDAVELPVVRVDWRGLPAEVLRQRLLARANAERSEGFHLARAPLMRLFMARVGDAAWSVLWTFHHVILDGRSFPLILREVFDIHDALRGRTEPSLSLPMPFRRAVEQGAAIDVAAAQRFWRELLDGYRGPTRVGLELPPGLAARGPRDQPFGARHRTLSPELSRALVERARAASVSVATLLYAAWALALHRCSGSTDLVFGTTRSTRHALPGDPASWIGPFIITVPLRVAVDRQQTVDDWLAQIRKQQVAMRPHEQLPLTAIQACAHAGPDQPLFDTLVVYDHASLSAQMRQLGPTWAQRHFDYVGQTGYPMTLVAYGDEAMPLRLEYDRRRFSDASAERLLGYVCTVLLALAEDQHERVGQLPWMTAEERQLLMGTTPQRFEPCLPLHRLFEQQALRAPLSPAVTVVAPDGRRHEVSYGRLNAQANRLARRLQARAVGPGYHVGLRAERNLDVVLGILAILKAGAAYVPLDPAYPDERAGWMLQDAGIRVALVSSGIAARWQPAGLERILIEQGQAQGEADALLAWEEAEANLLDTAKPSDLAYVIYTSGSTGQPKGVPITHHAVERLMSATRADFGFDERDVWTLFHSYAFDFSVWELWGALLHGGRLVVVPHELSRDPEAFFELVVRERVTVLNQTPTAFRRLVDVARHRPPAPLSLRYVIFGGEALELQMLRPWFERYGDTRPQLVNMYGITETTVHVTRRVLSEQDVEDGLGSVIGEPLADLRLLLLDPQGELVPLGAAGEIVVGGDGLSPGYLNRPDLTAERFISDPFSDEPGQRLYRSGDLARWLDNGELEYLGRLDQQVKIRGFRIEPGEIEAQISRSPWVRQVAVVAREDEPGVRRLVAYVVAADVESGPAAVSWAEARRLLLQRLREALPDYMVPAEVIRLAVLPLTVHGKLDVKALPALETPRPDTAAAPSAAAWSVPPTPTEARLLPIWSGVLRRQDIVVTDHFFELGGDSILSIQIVARCRAQGWRLSLKDLFDCPTIESLARRIDERYPDGPDASAVAQASGGPLGRVQPAVHPAAKAIIEAPSTPPPVRQAPGVLEPVPEPARAEAEQLRHPGLSPIQHWFFDQDFAEPHHWNQAVCFELFDGITGEQINAALQELIVHHPSLGLRFDRDSQGRVTQRWASPGDRETLVQVDLRGLEPEAVRTVWAERAAEAQAGLDLSRGPLLRAVHVVLDGGTARLLLVVHHLVVDGVSWRILREDLEELIEARRLGRPAQLPERTASVSDWNEALQRYATRFEVLAALPTWAALASVPVDPLPSPPPAPGLRGQVDRMHLLRLGSEPTRRLLGDVGRHVGVSINAVLVSALLRALALHSRQTCWRLDMEGHGREPIDEQLDVSRTVGWFTSLFPVVLSLPTSPEADAAQTMRHVHEQLQHVHDRGLSFGVLRWMGPPQAREQLAEVPAASMLFNYLGQWDAVVAGSSLFRFAEESPGPLRSAAAHRSHAVEWVVLVRSGLLELTASHDDQQVDPQWVDRVLGAWALTLQHWLAVVAPPPPATLIVDETLHPAANLAAQGPDDGGAADPTLTESNLVPELGPGSQVAATAAATVTSTAPSPAPSPASDGDAVTVPTDGAFALTPIQKLFFVMDQVRPELGLQQWQFVLEGPLNPVRLRRALARVLERHEILRCAFWEDDGQAPRQQPVADCEVPWVEQDWRDLTGAEPARRLAADLAEDQRTGFDLRRPPLMRVRLIRLADTTWHLIWTTHHLTLDGWSWPLVMGEWSRAYAALEGGWALNEPPALPYRQFVAWREANRHHHDSFWRSLLVGFQAPTPVMVKSPTTQDSAPVEHVIEMQEAQCLRLAALARRWRVTVSTLAHAAWAVCLAHANGVQTVLFGTTLAGRPPELPGVESLVGPCINNLPVPVRLDPGQPVDAFLAALQAQQVALAEHQYTSLEAIQRASAMAWRHRLFDSLLVFQNNQTDPDVSRMGTQVRSTLIAVPEATNVPLTVTITPTTGWRLRFMAARGSGLGEAELRRWVEDLMAVWAALDALGLQEESGRPLQMADWLARLPTASAGRVRAAAGPEVESASGAVPSGEIESQLVAIWSELLGTRAVSVSTNLFDLGVHSLLLVRAHQVINERFDLNLPLVSLLEHASIRALARHIAGLSEPSASTMAQSALARARQLHAARRREPVRMASRRPDE